MTERGSRRALPPPGAGERRVAARSVAWGGVESAASAAVGLILTPLVVRTTGMEGLGLWGACWSLAHTAGIIDLGIGASYARFTARALARDDAEDLNGVLAVGVGLHLALALLVALPAFLLGPALLARAAAGSPHLAAARTVLACTLLTVLLRGVLSAYRGVVAGAQRTDLLGRIGAVAALAEGGAGATALLCGLGLEGMAVGSLLAAVATSTAEAIAAHRLCPALRLRPFAARREQYGRLLAFGSRLQVIRAFEILGAHAPRLLLAAGPGLAAVGAYDLAARLAALATAGAALPLRVVLPLAGHLEARGDSLRLDALLERASRYVAVLVIVPAAAILVFAAPLLTAWTGRPAPPDAAMAARLLALAAVIGMSAAPLRLIVRGLGQAGIEAAATASGAAVQLALLAAIASRLRAPGAATAALAGSLVSAAGLAILVARRRVQADPGIAARAALRAIGACGIAVLSAVAIDHLLPAAVPADRSTALALLAPRLGTLLAAFAAGAAITGAIGVKDLGMLRDLLSPAPGCAQGSTGVPPGGTP